MSAGWGIRSKGDPYFGFIQRNAFGTVGGPFGGGGEFSMTLILSFQGPPVRYNDDDEEHALFSYFEHPTTNGDLLTIGVTPSGRIYGRGPSTNKLQTQPGLLSWDNSIHTLGFQYLIGGNMTITLDGVVQITGTGPGGQPQPAADKFGKFSLFTGVAALSRVPCTILSAVLGDENAGLNYPIEEGSGSSVASLPQDDFPAVDFTLAAQYWNPPFYTPVWGSNPSQPATHAFQWKYRNDWSRVPRTPNNWARV